MRHALFCSFRLGRDAAAFGYHRLFTRKQWDRASLAVRAEAVGDDETLSAFLELRAILFSYKLKTLKLELELKYLKFKCFKVVLDVKYLKLCIRVMPVWCGFHRRVFWFGVWLGFVDPVAHRDRMLARRRLNFLQNVRAMARRGEALF